MIGGHHHAGGIAAVAPAPDANAIGVNKVQGAAELTVWWPNRDCNLNGWNEMHLLNGLHVYAFGTCEQKMKQKRVKLSWLVTYPSKSKVNRNTILNVNIGNDMSKSKMSSEIDYQF